MPVYRIELSMKYLQLSLFVSRRISLIVTVQFVKNIFFVSFAFLALFSPILFTVSRTEGFLYHLINVVLSFWGQS